MKLTGILADLPTPFGFDGALYAKKVEQNIARYNLLELTGYVLGSTLGEGAALTAAERAQLWKLAKDAAAPGKTLIAALPEMGLRPAVEAIETAAQLGFDAALAPEPHWPSELAGGNDPATLYLRTLADRSPLPLIIQSGHAGRPALPPDTAAAIAAHPNVAAIHEPSGHTQRLSALREAVAATAQVLTGSLDTLDEALGGSASGAILGLAAAVPFHCLNIADAVRKREAAAAQQLCARLTPAAYALRHELGVAGLKWAMDLRGYYGGPPRLPLVPLTPAMKTKLEALLQDISN